MGRLFGSLNFSDKFCNTASKIFGKVYTPFEWSYKESFKNDFFNLLKFSPRKNDDTYFFNSQDLFLIFDGQVYDDDNQAYGKISKNTKNTLLNKLITIYHDQGPEHLCGLNGMYLIVVWDKSLKTLFIANDMLGLKPCYYWFYSNELLFGTQYEFMTYHPKFIKDVNNEAIVELMLMGCVLEDHTLFKRIKCLLPGSLLICKDGYLDIKKISHLKLSDSRWGIPTFQLVEEMAGYLEQSVKIRLKNSESTLVPLSGGLDSRTLVGFCKKYCSNMDTLTYGLKKHTDVKIARKIAKNLKLSNIFLNQGDDFLIKYSDTHLNITEGSAELLTANILPVLEFAQNKFQDIVIAYLGDGLHGENYSHMIKNLKNKTTPEDALYSYYYSKSLSPQVLSNYLSDNLKPLIHKPGDTIKNFFKNIDGNILHQCLLTDIYYRYRHYISSQLNLLEDCAHIHAPFTDTNYLNFILSLPPMAFEDKYIYKKMITSTFPQISYLADANSLMPPGLCANDTFKKSMIHSIFLALVISTEFIFEIPQQLLSNPRNIRPKHSMWNTFYYIEKSQRLKFGNIVRGVYEYLGDFFDLNALDNLFFSKATGSFPNRSVKVRRIYGIALWFKRYFT